MSKTILRALCLHSIENTWPSLALHVTKKARGLLPNSQFYFRKLLRVHFFDTTIYINERTLHKCENLELPTPRARFITPPIIESY